MFYDPKHYWKKIEIKNNPQNASMFDGGISNPSWLLVLFNSVGSDGTTNFQIILEVARGPVFAGDVGEKIHLISIYFIQHIFPVAIDDIKFLNHACKPLTSNQPTLPLSPIPDEDLMQIAVSPIESAEEDLNLRFESRNTSDTATNYPETIVDIYEIGNRSFVDEPSTFTNIKVLTNVSVTINPSKSDFPFFDHSKKSAEASADATDERTIIPNRLFVYIGVAIAGSLLAILMIAAVIFALWRRRKQVVEKTTTEETEFQYFSYANEGFHEVSTLPVDRMITNKK